MGGLHGIALSRAVWDVAVKESEKRRKEEVNSMIYGNSNIVVKSIPELLEESNMNSVKMILSDGKDQLVKIIDMTDIMVEYLSTDKKIMILSRDMPVNSLTLTDSQWYASVGFKRKEESDECMSKAEFMELVNDGWTFKGE